MGRKARIKRDRRAERQAPAQESESARELRRILASTGVASVDGTSPGQVKVSDALLQIAQPFIDRIAPNQMTRERLEALLKVATLVWNVELLPDGSGSRFLDEVLRLPEAQGVDPAVTRELVTVMLERRRQKFAADRRPVVKVVVREGAKADIREIDPYESMIVSHN